MSQFTTQPNRLLCALSLVAVTFISSCSDDNKEASTKKVTMLDNKEVIKNDSVKKEYYEQMSKPIDNPTWVEKSKFKKEFSKDCIGRELKNAGNSKVDHKFIETTCDCIADYMDNNLSDQEAEEFLRDDNHMRALQIRYDSAAYQCIQGSKKTSEPKITKFK